MNAKATNWWDFHEARHVDRSPNFNIMLMALIVKADLGNLERLRKAFPEVVEETLARREAPGGFLSEKERQLHGVRSIAEAYEREEEPISDEERWDLFAEGGR